MTLFTTSRPTISVKSVTRYPTRITTGTGLSYTYDNGTLNISLDYSDIPDSAAIADPSNYTTVVYNKTTGLLEEVQLDYIPTTVVTDPVYTRGDSNFTIPNDYRVLSLVANLTASRTWTLPSAANVTSGDRIFIYDTVGGVSAAYPLVIAAPSGNTINGASSITLSNAFAGITIVSNSGTQWTAILTNVDSVGGLGTNVANALKSAVNSANGVIRLDSSGNVPALNGAALTNLNASNLGSGTVPAARLPGPSLSTLGGVKAKAAETSKFVNQIDTDGSVNLAQPAFSDISGSVAASQLPNPSASTLGGVQSKAAESNKFLTAIGTDGAVASAQPAVSDLFGFGTSVATALGVNVGAAGSVVVNGGALGTPASGNLANCTFPTLNQNTTGTAAGLSATLAVTSGGTGVTTLTGLAKGNGTSAFTAAAAGTDYLAPPSGTAILKANSGGALANATAGTDYVAPGGALGTPSSGTLTNCIGYTVGNLSGAGTGVVTALGNATNGASGIVTLNGSSQLPAVDGSLLTGILSSSKGFFYKDDISSVVFTKTGAGTVSIKAATVVVVATTTVTFSTATAVTMPTLTAGTDYAIYVCTDSSIRADASFTAPTGYTAANSRKIGGFHYAPGGNATGTSGGDTTPAINAYSLWDLKWRPACTDPRGMALVSDGFWCDIYLLNTDPGANGTSKYNVTIADGSSPPKIPTAFGGNGSTAYSSLNWWEAEEVLRAYGKAPLTYDEFAAAMYGTTEASGSGTDPGSTILRNAYTSKWGIMLATGNMWIWGANFGGGAAAAGWTANTGGRGSTYLMENAVILGGYWGDGSNCGSRCSHWSNSPPVSANYIGARGRCDHLILV